MHHRRVVGDEADHRQIVADDDQRQAVLLAEFLEKIEQVALDRDIEARRRLVGNEDARAYRRALRSATRRAWPPLS